MSNQFLNEIKRLLKRSDTISKIFRKKPDKFLRDISGLVHVGANTGQEREIYKALGLKVLWVEPIPEIFEQLEKNIESYDDQIAFQALITDEENKEYEFHIANNNGASSSILELKDHKDIWPDIDFKSTIRLKSRTLSSLYDQESFNRSNYEALIMDTQGSELLVLKGAIPILKHFKYIKTEVADFEAYENCCKLDDIREFMNEQGYEEDRLQKFAHRAKGGNYYDVIYKLK